MEGSEAFDLSIGVGEEIVDQRVELVLFEDGDGVAGVRDDPQIRLGNVFGDRHGVANGDGVVVAADHQGRAGDVVQLVEGDIGLIEVEVDDLLFVLVFGCPWLFGQAAVFCFDQVKDEGRQAGGVGPEVGAGEGHLFHFVGMADGEEEGVDAAVAPADDIAAIEVEGIEEGAEIVDDLFEGQRVGGVFGFAVCAGVDGDDLIVLGEIRDLVGHITDGAAVAMEQQERFALAIGLIIELKTAGRKVMAGGGIVAVMDLGIGRLVKKDQEQREQQGEFSHK